MCAYVYVCVCVCLCECVCDILVVCVCVCVCSRVSFVEKDLRVNVMLVYDMMRVCKCVGISCLCM